MRKRTRSRKRSNKGILQIQTRKTDYASRAVLSIRDLNFLKSPQPTVVVSCFLQFNDKQGVMVSGWGF